MQNSEGLELVVPGITSDYSQLDAVSEALNFNFNRWMTLDQIAAITGVESRSSIASRIRDLRAFGSTIIRRLHPTAGAKTRIFEYKLVA